MVSLKQVEYSDVAGRHWARMLPNSEPNSRAGIGIPVGPPPLDSLDLPEDLQTRLHNELYARGILTLDQALTNRREIQAAMMAAFRLDVDRIIACYRGLDDAATPRPTERI